MWKAGICNGCHQVIAIGPWALKEIQAGKLGWCGETGKRVAVTLA